jgi:sulfite exporter TauE/SafE
VLHRIVVAVLHRIRERSPLERAALMGLVTSLLPCGFLWAFVAVAAGAGSPLAGAVVLAAFWAGTVPVLVGVGLVARGPLAVLGRRAPIVTAALLMVLGGLTMAGRLQPAHASHASCCHAHATP